MKRLILVLLVPLLVGCYSTQGRQLDALIAQRQARLDYLRAWMTPEERLEFDKQLYMQQQGALAEILRAMATPSNQTQPVFILPPPTSTGNEWRDFARNFYYYYNLYR